MSKSILKTVQFSVILDVHHPTVLGNVSIDELLKSIKTGYPLLSEYPFISTVKQIRGILASGQNKEKSRELKLKLPKIFPHACFPKDARIGQNTSSEVTGFVHYDIDGIDHLDMIEISDTLKTLNPYFFFKSPSNNGYKVFFLTSMRGKRILGQEANLIDMNFKAVWQFLANKVDEVLLQISEKYKVDRAPQNLASGFFMSFDENLWVNPNPEACQIDVSNIQTQTSIPKSKEIKKVSSKMIPIKQNVVLLGSYPEKKDILEHLKGVIPPKKQKTAINAINEYFQTSRMEGKRYAAFFRMASILVKLGISDNDGQKWTEDKFGDFLEFLDYDSSRQKKNQIQGSITSLKKNGDFSKTNKKQQQQEMFKEHLNSYLKPHKTFEVNKFASESYQDILQEIKNNRFTLLDSPTGSGKSNLILTRLINDIDDGRIFFALPFRTVIAQLGKRQNDDRIQCLFDGDDLDPSKKLFMCTYEKMINLLDSMSASDLLVIDEIHLFSDSFRSSTTSKILHKIKEKAIRTLGLSASAQLFASCLQKIIDLRYLKITCKNASVRTLNISKVQNSKYITDFCLDRIETILKANSCEKILVFKNNKEDLFDIQTELNKRGIKSLVVTSETSKTSIEVQQILEGASISKYDVLLSTKVCELGVEFKEITYQFILGDQYDSNAICQMSNRSRNAQTKIEWVISDKKQDDSHFEKCFEKDILNKYLREAQHFTKLENKLLTVVYPQGINTKRASEDYITSRNNTLMRPLEKDDPPHRLRNLLMNIPDKRGIFRIVFNIQGWIQNLEHIEKRNEENLDYMIQKLEDFWNIKAEVQYFEYTSPKEDEKRDTRSIARCLNILKENFPEKSDNLRDDIENTLMQYGETNSQEISEIQKKIVDRFFDCRRYALNLKEYLFLPDAEFKRVMDLCLIKSTPQKVNPIEHCLAEKLKQDGWMGKVLFKDDIVKIIDSLQVPKEAQHILDEIKKFSENGKSRFFRVLFNGRDVRRKQKNVKDVKQRGLILEGVAWENLKTEIIPPYSMHIDKDLEELLI